MGIVEDYLGRIGEVSDTFDSGLNMADPEDVLYLCEPCIYRGETKCYDQVVSNLYRHYANKDKNWYRLSDSQRELILFEASLDESSRMRQFPKTFGKNKEKTGFPEMMQKFSEGWERELKEKIEVLDLSKDYFRELYT